MKCLNIRFCNAKSAQQKEGYFDKITKKETVFKEKNENMQENNPKLAKKEKDS